MKKKVISIKSIKIRELIEALENIHSIHGNASCFINISTEKSEKEYDAENFRGIQSIFMPVDDTSYCVLQVRKVHIEEGTEH